MNWKEKLKIGEELKEKLKIGVLSAIGGAVVLSIIGFGFGGWVKGYLKYKLTKISRTLPYSLEVANIKKDNIPFKIE